MHVHDYCTRCIQWVKNGPELDYYLGNKVIQVSDDDMVTTLVCFLELERAQRLYVTACKIDRVTP